MPRLHALNKLDKTDQVLVFRPEDDKTYYITVEDLVKTIADFGDEKCQSESKKKTEVSLPPGQEKKVSPKKAVA